MASSRKNKKTVSASSKKQIDLHNDKPGKSSRNKQVADSPNFIQQIDKWMEPRLHYVFYVSLLFTVLFGILLFDVKISTGGDDSSYIEMANNFIQGKSFPSWHGPLYPIFLSLPMLVLGVKVVWLKLFSFVFIIAHLVLFYYTFRKKISPAIFSMVLLIVSVSSSILYFASQTYSEAMFMFLQSLIIILFIRTFQDTASSTPLPVKNQTVNWLILGFFVFLTSLTRNIGIVALLTMLFFLIIQRKFKPALLLGLSYLIFFIPFKLYKSIVWKAGSNGEQGQLAEILLKNPYNRAMGSEDFSGMVTRFFENAKGYLSKHFMIGLGLHDPSSTDKSWFVTGIIIVLFIIALYFAIKHSKIMLFVSIYMGATISATFIALQQTWDQMRMVIIYFPMLLLLLAWGIQQLASKKGYGFLNVLLPALLVLIFFKTLGITFDKVKVNQKVLAKNISGNRYYGFTPDWQNFLRMSEWVGENIPDTALVASRKPSMSFIYSKGRDFFGIYRFPTQEPEILVNALINRTGELQVIPNKQIVDPLPVDMQLAVKQHAVAFVAEGSDVYGVYNFKGQPGNELTNSLFQYNIAPFSTDSLLNRIRTSKQSCFAVSPDSLINTLRKSKVDYVIIASLRANPNMNTGNIINNIQRYLYFVEQKYPGILTLTHQIGADADEPAWLYRLNYHFYGL